MAHSRVSAKGWLLLTACALLLAAGCGGDLARVEGTVTLDGQPLTGGRVAFQAVESGAMGVAEIDPDGSYRVKTGSEAGLAPGRYRVAVTAYETRPAADALEEPIPVLVTPRRYNDPATSGLEVEIRAGRNEHDLVLTSE